MKPLLVALVALTLPGCFAQVSQVLQADEAERIDAILACAEDPGEPAAFEGVPTPAGVSKVAEPLPERKPSEPAPKKKGGRVVRVNSAKR